MSNTNYATATQIHNLKIRAVNSVTREIAANGVHLTHDQADELGDEVIAWIGGRLGLNVSSDSDGVHCLPPTHYVGRDENGDLIAAHDVQ